MLLKSKNDDDDVMMGLLKVIESYCRCFDNGWSRGVVVNAEIIWMDRNSNEMKNGIE